MSITYSACVRSCNVAAASLALGLLAQSQSINIDCNVTSGAGSGIPSAGFSAAAPASAADVWNSVSPSSASNVALVDTAGASVAAKASHTGGNLYDFDNLSTTGNDEKLLDDFQDFFGTVTWTIGPLQAGSYDVYSYAWAPDYPTGAYTRVTVTGATPGMVLVGGANFPGPGPNYVTPGHYALHSLVVSQGASITVVFGEHNSGVQVWTVNGLQLRHTPPAPVSLDCQQLPSATQGCSSSASFIGSPSATSASPFAITLGGLNVNVNGVVFYGVNGPHSVTWGPESLLCVKAPTQRMNGTSGAFGDTGGTAGSCDGAYSFDINPVLQAAGVTAGTNVVAQAWVRDTVSTKTTILSDALAFFVGP